MVAIASQLTDESTEAPEIDVAHIYLQAIRVEPKKQLGISNGPGRPGGPDQVRPAARFGPSLKAC